MPEARRLRRALEALGATVHRTQPGPRPLTEDDAPILAGMLRAMTELYEAGIVGTEDQTRYQFGRLAVHDHDEKRVLDTTAAQLYNATAFVVAAIGRVPGAARQLRIAALALDCAAWATSAAAEIAGHDGTPTELAAAGQLSAQAVDAAARLHKFMATLDELAQEHYRQQDSD
jgi:hypothetical protein